jgi:hypothetical protein
MVNAGQQGEEEEPEAVRARKCVEKIVPQHIEQWAAAIGLTATDEIQGDVTKALFECMLAHIAAPPVALEYRAKGLLGSGRRLRRYIETVASLGERSRSATIIL